MSSVALRILNNKEMREKRSSSEISMSIRFRSMLRKSYVRPNAKCSGDVMYVHGVQRDSLPSSFKNCPQLRKLITKETFSSTQDILSIEKYEEYLRYDNCVKDEVYQYLRGFMPLAFSIMLYHVKKYLQNCSDYKYFKIDLEDKFVILEALGRKRIFEYISAVSSSRRTPMQAANYANCQIYHLAFIVAESELLFKKSVVGNKNGRFVYQYIIDRFSLYLHCWGKFRGNTILGTDYNPHTAEKCTDVVQDIFEEILDVNETITRINDSSS